MFVQTVSWLHFLHQSHEDRRNPSFCPHVSELWHHEGCRQTRNFAFIIGWYIIEILRQYNRCKTSSHWSWRICNRSWGCWGVGGADVSGVWGGVCGGEAILAILGVEWGNTTANFLSEKVGCTGMVGMKGGSVGILELDAIADDPRVANESLRNQQY